MISSYGKYLSTLSDLKSFSSEDTNNKVNQIVKGSITK